jgi:hypothetical protein
MHSFSSWLLVAPTKPSKHRAIHCCEFTRLLILLLLLTLCHLSQSLASVASVNNQGPSQTQSGQNTNFVNGPSNTCLGTISKKSTPIGAIVGGVVGGIVAIAALAIGLLFFCRRKPNRAPPGSIDAHRHNMAVAGAAFGVAAVPYQYAGTSDDVPNPQGPSFSEPPEPPPNGYPEPYTYGTETSPMAFNHYNRPPLSVSPPPGYTEATPLNRPMHPEPVGENEATASPYTGHRGYDSSNRVSRKC